MPKQPKPLAEVESPGFLWEEHDRAMAIGEWKARQLRSEIQPDDKISGIRLWWQDYVADLEIKPEDPVSEVAPYYLTPGTSTARSRQAERRRSRRRAARCPLRGASA